MVSKTSKKWIKNGVNPLNTKELEVGSNPATPTKYILGMQRSLVAHTHGVRGVAGSNPVIPTQNIFYLSKNRDVYVMFY